MQSIHRLLVRCFFLYFLLHVFLSMLTVLLRFLAPISVRVSYWSIGFILLAGDAETIVPDGLGGCDKSIVFLRFLAFYRLSRDRSASVGLKKLFVHFSHSLTLVHSLSWSLCTVQIAFCCLAYGPGVFFFLPVYCNNLRSYQACTSNLVWEALITRKSLWLMKKQLNNAVLHWIIPAHTDDKLHNTYHLIICG